MGLYWFELGSKTVRVEDWGWDVHAHDSPKTSEAGSLAVAALLIGLDPIAVLAADSGPTVSVTGGQVRVPDMHYVEWIMGKIHVTVGTADTYRAEQAGRLLEIKTLKELRRTLASGGAWVTSPKGLSLSVLRGVIDRLKRNHLWVLLLLGALCSVITGQRRSPR